MTQTRKEKLREELRRLKLEFAAMVVQFAQSNSTLTYEEIGKKIGIDKAEVATLCKAAGFSRGRGGASTSFKGKTNEQK
jgi:hypothetical protein